jgi:sn-glycerol 3-phosphate transport system substrate-binding protein
LVSRFAADNPGIEVHLEDLGSGGRDGVLRSWRATSPRNRPSLAIMSEDATRLLADSGQTMAPGHCLTDAVPGLVPAIEASWSVNDVVQAVPLAVSTPVLLYNRRAFRDAGLDPDRPPSSLDDLRRAAEQLVEWGRVPTGLVFDTGAEGAAGWLVEQWNAQADVMSLAPDNGRRGIAESALWHDGPAVDNLAWLQTMVSDGLAATVGTNTSGIDDLTALVGDPPQAAMALHTSGSIAPMIHAFEAAPPARFELGVAPLPGPGQGSLPGGSAVWLAAGKSGAETQAAWALAAFLGSPAVQSQWAAETGYVPITQAAVEMEPLRSAWARRPELAVAYRVLSEHGVSAAALGMSVGPEREIKELLGGALGVVVVGGDPADVLRSVAVDANRLLRTYNRGLDDAPSG